MTQPNDDSHGLADDFDGPIDRDPELAKFDAAIDLEPDEDADEFADAAPPAGPVRSELQQIDAELTAATFYDAGVDLHALDDLQVQGRPSVLERLGPAHFRSKGFSFMGFLQTVYDHVAEELKKPASTAAVAEPAPAAESAPTAEPAASASASAPNEPEA